MKNYRTAMVAGASLTAMILAAPGVALAQSAGPELQEVVVTAQRRAEKLEDVPVAVVAVSSDNLESAGIVKMQELGQITSGVSISRIGPYSQPAVRGVSSSLFGNGLENNVAVYIDGYYQPDSMGLNGDLANIDSIQILKGPQGTLYGRNATGGAILMTSKAPSYDKLTGRIGAGYGNLDDRSVQFYLSGPLIADKLAFSIAGSNRENDGFIKDVGARAWPASIPFQPLSEAASQFDAAPYLSRLFRAKLEAKPTDWATITLAYNYAKISDARTNTWTQKRYQIAAFFPPGSATELDKTSMNLKPINSQTTDEFTLSGKFDVPGGQLSTYLGYAKRNAHLKYDFDGTKLDIVSSEARYPERTYQAAADYAARAFDRLDLVVGASYYSDVFAPDGLSYANFAPTRKSQIKRKLWAYAFYADATYEVTDKLFLTGGVRYSSEKQHVVSFSQGLVAGQATLNFPTPLKEKWSATTFRAVARYEIADRTNVYASFSQGFKSGTFNALSAFTTIAASAPVDNEDIDAYEVGFKTAMGRYRFNAAAYYYDYTNFQVSLTVPVNPANPLLGTTTAVGNAPKAEVYGAEADIQAAVTEAFNLRAAVSYTHGRYKEFPNASGTGLRATPTINIVPQTQDWSGLRMLRAPTWTASLSGDYTIPMLDGSLKLAGSIYYSSSYIPNNISVYGPLAPANRPARKQRYISPKYATANVSAAWTAPGDQLIVTAYVNNVTDERHHIINSGSTFGDYLFYTDPRTYGVRISYDF